MTNEELTVLLAAARTIAEEAGRTVMEGFRRPITVKKKGGIDLVTDRDLASEALIRARMAAAFPDHGVIAEEGEAEASARSKEYVWYCDPIDGTTNFAHGHFFFAVSLGLTHRGQPLAGVIHAPALRTTWWGAVGLGTFRETIRETEGNPQERCTVRGGERLLDSVIATGFPYDRGTSPENNVREFSRIVLLVRGMRRCGSAALDLAQVADGTYDGYWEQKLAPWDLSAGAALVLASGGTLTGYEGEPLSIPSGRVVATNGKIHEELLAEIAAARR